MPQLSRYSDEHVEQLLSELLSVLENIRRRPIFPDGAGKYGHQPYQHQRGAGSTPGDCELFARALQSSISEDNAH